jgi:hypothetical protein
MPPQRHEACRLDFAPARQGARNDAKIYNRLVWNDKGTALAVLMGLVDKVRERPNVRRSSERVGIDSGSLRSCDADPQKPLVSQGLVQSYSANVGATTDARVLRHQGAGAGARRESRNRDTTATSTSGTRSPDEPSSRRWPVRRDPQFTYRWRWW